MAAFDEADGGFYDATYFDVIEQRYRTGAHGSRYRNILRCIGPTAGERILDLGCGSGIFAAELAKSGAEVIGVDYAPAAIAYGRLHYPKLALQVGSAYELETMFEAESLSQVLLLDVIEHMSDHAALMRGIRHVLQPGGRVVISTDNDRGIWSRQPWSRYYEALQRFSREGRAYRRIKAAEARNAQHRHYQASHINCLSTEALQALLREHHFTIALHRTYAMVGVPLRDAVLQLLPWDQRGDHQCLVAVKQAATHPAGTTAP